MRRHKTTKLLSCLMAVIMAIGLLSPTAWAMENTSEDPDPKWEAFMEGLKDLEGYVATYAAMNNQDANGLVINFIRTGVDKYNTDDWAILAGPENKEFVAYVTAQDTANGTTASSLRDIEEFTTPNKQTVEFGHMFGALDIAYHNNGATEPADFGSWAGDICDLMDFSHGKVTATDVEEMAKEIRENYLGVDDGAGDDQSSFSYTDIYGDLDANYLMTKLSTTSRSLSTIMEYYFTESLTDTDRASLFLKNRFSGKNTQEEIRSAVLEAYRSNPTCGMLEADRGLTEEHDLRTACCYAFADYLYELAKDKLPGDNTYYDVFNSTSSNIAPGITQTINYAMTADNKQLVYYIATADIARSDVGIYANYKNNDGSSWGMSRVTDQMAAAQAKHSDPESENYIKNYNAVVGVNADFYDMTTGKPSGALVMEGVTYQGAQNENFFAILKDGTAVIGAPSEWDIYADQVQEAVGGSTYLIKDGKIAVSPSDDYYTSRASRTCVGITEDGQVILMVLDGRQEPFSAGGSYQEIAQIMLDAGCVEAINLDGGGSTTFAAKQEGEDTVKVVNRPSDGYERSVSSSLMVVSTAETSAEFDHAVLSSDYTYLTAGTTLPVTATGVSESGNAAEIPAGVVWATSDSAVATVDAAGNVTAVAAGEVEIQLMLDGAVVGSQTLHVIGAPDQLSFSKERMNVVYGVETTLPIEATYNGNPVAIHAKDITFSLSSPNAGEMKGFAFIGNEESGVRNLVVEASLTRDISVKASITLALYKDGEAIFDFDNATSGDRKFAWNREVSNSTTEDEKYYHIADPAQGMDISYVFALDMEVVEVPEQLKPLLGLLPGGDSSTAWQLLLQLAERVNPLTNVKVSMQVDPNVDIDCSNIRLVNDYFELTGTEYDAQKHTLTLTFNFIDQSQAIDPAGANPICIVSGIRAIPREDAAWDENECLTILNTGEIAYDIYLRSSTLHNIVSKPEIQEQFGIYPFEDEKGERGGHFASTYVQFTEEFTLDKSVYQGWKTVGDSLYYFVNNAPLTGIQKVPGYQDEKNEYYYNFGEDGVCQGKVSGLFELNGELYYAVNGKLETGWRTLSNNEGGVDYYYFYPDTGKAADGKAYIEGYHFTFVDHILTQGELVTTSTGKMHYRWANFWVMNTWLEIDGNKYFATRDAIGLGYFAEGITRVREYDGTGYGYYLFGSDCVWQEDFNGLYTDANGDVYPLENGRVIEFAGLMKIGEDYYYFGESNKAVRGKQAWVSEAKTNGLLPEGMYTFGDDGKMVREKNGIVAEDGSLWYYENGKRTYAGLIQIDGDYYYVRSSGEVVHDRKYWITRTNGLLPEGTYAFGADGKMILEPEEKNGIVAEDGSLWYYENGKRTYAGLIQIDGDYYYVRSSGEVVHGRKYWVTRTNGLLPEGNYTFDETGKMIF